VRERGRTRSRPRGESSPFRAPSDPRSPREGRRMPRGASADGASSPRRRERASVRANVGPQPYIGRRSPMLRVDALARRFDAGRRARPLGRALNASPKRFRCPGLQSGVHVEGMPQGRAGSPTVAPLPTPPAAPPETWRRAPNRRAKCSPRAPPRSASRARARAPSPPVAPTPAARKCAPRLRWRPPAHRR
jgi:hypothetical protein